MTIPTSAFSASSELSQLSNNADVKRYRELERPIRLTAVLDTYVHIPLISAVVPFASGYERLWLALGAVSLDIMLAMIVTSLLRGRLNRILWRAVHLLAYASWPVAFAHSIGSSKDLQQGWMLGLAVGCAMIVAAAAIWRLAHAARQVPRARRVAAVFSQRTVTR